MLRASAMLAFVLAAAAFLCSVIVLGLHGGSNKNGDFNSFVGKANYYGTHVVQDKKCCALQENVVSNQLTLYDQEICC